ncbi:UPF0481 protein At3g47200-like [Typha latifolia]|uniref:UPF0481 protein At3g47200-like n=1 Tax=Typha latifolia TaxID=4733 RepID=UPI003C2CA42D
MERRTKDNSGERRAMPPLPLPPDTPIRRRPLWHNSTVFARHRRTSSLSSLPPSTPTTTKETVDKPPDDLRLAVPPQPEIHLNPAWPDAVINLIRKSNLNPNYHDDPCTIHRAPPPPQDAAGDVYLPKAVCIGPYFPSFRHLPAFRHTQDYKWWCVQKLISRYDGLAEPDRTPVLMQRCSMFLKAVDAQLRQAYAESISLDNDELAEMMMLDGCFILHLLLKNSKEMDEKKRRELEEGSSASNRINTSTSLAIGRPWIWNMVIFDLLLLENQIPFFVISILFDVFKIKDDDGVDLIACALRVFDQIHPHRPSPDMRTCGSVQVHHLLHLYYLSLIPSSQSNNYSSSKPPPSSSSQRIPSATKLREAGIKLRKGKESLSFLDVKFKDGVMEIPTLEIHDYTIPLFRNALAFEQCNPRSLCYITNYVAFMNCLVANAMDVRLMHAIEILVDKRSNINEQEGIQYFFHQLCHGQASYDSDENYLRGMLVDLTRYHGHSKDDKEWRGLVHDYFTSPYVVFSMGAAIVFLILANILQAYFAAYSCVRSSQ